MMLSFLFINIGLVMLIFLSKKRFKQIRYKKYDIKTVQFLLITISLISLKYVIEANKWGGWDAWSIWNLHAKFLSNSASFQNYYDKSLSYSHLDYPKLLPALVALGWKVTGSDTYLVPYLISLLILLGTLVVILDFIDDIKFQLPVVIIFLIDDTILRFSASQYADTMLAFLIVLSIAGYIEFRNYKSKDSVVKLLVLLLLSSFVKNEGLVFALLFFIILLLKVSKVGVLKKYSKWFVFFSFLFIGEIVDKIFFTISNDIISAQSSSMIYKLLDIKRYIVIYKYLMGQLFFDYKILLILIFCFAFMHKMFELLEVYYLLILVFTSYLLVYLITPHDLIWHLSTSIDRLLHHVYLGFIFIFFYSLNNQSYRQPPNPTLVKSV